MTNRASERNRIIEFNLLSITPFHTFHTSPTLPQFVRCYLCQSVVFGFPHFASCPACGNAGQCVALWKCVSNVNLRHKLSFKNSQKLHDYSHPQYYPQFDTIFQVWYWNFCHTIFCKGIYQKSLFTWTKPKRYKGNYPPLFVKKNSLHTIPWTFNT